MFGGVSAPAPKQPTVMSEDGGEITVHWAQGDAPAMLTEVPEKVGEAIESMRQHGTPVALVLSANGLRGLGACCARLPLVALDLSHNQLRSCAAVESGELAGDGDAPPGASPPPKVPRTVSALPPTLTALNLSHNGLARLAGMERLPRLRALDVSHNRLVTCAGMGWLAALEDLDLAHNALSQSRSLNVLRYLGPLTSLRSLALDGNPMAAMGGLRLNVGAMRRTSRSSTAPCPAAAARRSTRARRSRARRRPRRRGSSPPRRSRRRRQPRAGRLERGGGGGGGGGSVASVSSVGLGSPPSRPPRAPRERAARQGLPAPRRAAAAAAAARGRARARRLRGRRAHPAALVAAPVARRAAPPPARRARRRQREAIDGFVGFARAFRAGASGSPRAGATPKASARRATRSASAPPAHARRARAVARGGDRRAAADAAEGRLLAGARSRAGARLRECSQRVGDLAQLEPDVKAGGAAPPDAKATAARARRSRSAIT